MSELPPDDVIKFRVKVELRKRMRGLRNTVPASACAQRSARIVLALQEHEAIKAARHVALFWPIAPRHEVDLRPLDETLRARGVHVAYPSIDPDTREMTFRLAAKEELAERGMGFEEPLTEALVPSSLDVIVVPALAVEPRGYRLGYGAGFYDRALPHWPAAVSIAVAYDFQLLAELPVTAGDVAVGWICTDSRCFVAGDPS